MKTGIMHEEIWRAFVNKRFRVVIFLAVTSFAYGFARVIELQQTNPLDAVALWQAILNRGFYGFFAALMAGLPFADSLLLDRRHRFVNQILLRCGYRPYLSAKVAACVGAGITAVAAPALLLLAGCVLFFPVNRFSVSDISVGVNEILNPGVIEPNANLMMSLPGYILLCALMLVLFGAAYALLALGASFVIRNPFIVLGFPFICYSLGYFIIPTSKHLAWLGSSEAALLPSVSLLSPLLQYLFAGSLYLFFWLFWGKKDRLLLD